VRRIRRRLLWDLLLPFGFLGRSRDPDLLVAQRLRRNLRVRKGHRFIRNSTLAHLIKMHHHEHSMARTVCGPVCNAWPDVLSFKPPAKADQLAEKSLKLERKGNHARAAECYRAALDHAEGRWGRTTGTWRGFLCGIGWPFGMRDSTPGRRGSSRELTRCGPSTGRGTHPIDDGREGSVAEPVIAWTRPGVAAFWPGEETACRVGVLHGLRRMLIGRCACAAPPDSNARTSGVAAGIKGPDAGSRAGSQGDRAWHISR